MNDGIGIKVLESASSLKFAVIISHPATDTFLTVSIHRLSLEGSFGKSCFPNRCHGASFMRTGYFYSLVFALLTSASIAAVAAPAVKPEAGNAPQVQQMSVETPSGKVDLNKADASTLQSELSGIGEAKAQAIVAYRESNGAFSSVDELLEVKGIGKALLDKNREKLVVN
jgi:competence protein ComEA